MNYQARQYQQQAAAANLRTERDRYRTYAAVGIALAVVFFAILVVTSTIAGKKKKGGGETGGKGSGKSGGMMKK